jgi:hypothetical protein
MNVVTASPKNSFFLQFEKKEKEKKKIGYHLKLHINHPKQMDFFKITTSTLLWGF